MYSVTAYWLIITLCIELTYNQLYTVSVTGYWDPSRSLHFKMIDDCSHDKYFSKS